MLRNKKLFRNSRGDTIIEVLLSVAVMSLILTISYGLANRDSQYVRTAQERGEAQKLTEQQLEWLRQYITPATTWNSSNTCLALTANKPEPTADESRCKVGIQDGGVGRYFVTLRAVATDTYTATATWDTLTGNQGRLELSYRLPADGVGGSFTLPPDPECNNGHDDDDPEDTLVDLLDPGCAGDPTRNSELDPPPLPPNPVQFVVDTISHTFPSWHLAKTAGTKSSKLITISNTSSTAESNIGPLTLSGSNTNSFEVTTNVCENKTLAPLESCQILVEFYPPSGGANNHLGNAGNKTATLVIGGGSGSSNRSVALSGMTYSDRMRAGDSLVKDTDKAVLWSYNSNCYKNLENDCVNSTSTFALQTDGNTTRVFNGGQTVCMPTRWCTGYNWVPPSVPFPGYHHLTSNIDLETNGNFAFRRANGQIVKNWHLPAVFHLMNPWSPAPILPGSWVRLYNDGALDVNRPSPAYDSASAAILYYRIIAPDAAANTDPISSFWDCPHPSEWGYAWCQ